MVDEVAVFLYGLIKFHRPELVVQTGHLWGKSAVFVLEALTDGFLDIDRFEPISREGDPGFRDFVEDHVPRRKLPAIMISVDPDPLGVGDWDSGVKLLNQWYDGFFVFQHMRSDQFLPTFKPVTKNVLAIVDGDHTRQGCTKDLEACAELQANCIVVDDTEWLPELKDVSRTFASQRGYESISFTPYNGVTLLVKG